MGRIFKRLYSLIGFTLIAAGCGTPNGSSIGPANLDSLSADQKTELGWAEKACLQSEYGSDRGRVIRWAKSPTISAMNGDAAQKTALTAEIKEINRVLSTTPIQLIPVRDADSSADIQVNFGPLAQMQALASSMGANFDSGNEGIFWTWWNGNYEYTKTRIFMATDLIDPSKMGPLLLEEVGQSLGPQNDTPLYRDSITFEDENGSGFTPTLQARDEKLFHFLYNYTNPGDDQNTFDAAYVKNWNSIN